MFVLLLGMALLLCIEYTAARRNLLGTPTVSPTPAPSTSNSYKEGSGTSSYDGWDYVAVSASGQYVYAAGGTNGDQIISTADFGDTWSCCYVSSVDGSITSIAVDSTGQNVVYVNNGGYVRTSYDYGGHFSTAYSSTLEWSSVAVSSDFVTMFLVAFDNDYLYRSTNSGVDWEHFNQPFSNYFSPDTHALSLSFNTSYVGFCSEYGDPQLSQGTYGSSFVQLNLDSLYFYTSMAISGNTGQYIAIAASYVSNDQPVGIMVSSNFGNDFTMSNAAYGSRSPVVSATGQYMAAVVSTGTALSTTYGSSWFLAELYGGGTRAGMNANGAFVYLVSESIYIISMDVPGGPTEMPTGAPSAALTFPSSMPTISTFLPASLPTSQPTSPSNPGNGTGSHEPSHAIAKSIGITLGVVIFVVVFSAGIFYYIKFGQAKAFPSTATPNDTTNSINATETVETAMARGAKVFHNPIYQSNNSTQQPKSNIE